MQRATAVAEAAQQQLRAQADQEVKRTASIQALQQHVSQELATTIAQNIVTLQPAPDRLTLRVRSEAPRPKGGASYGQEGTPRTMPAPTLLPFSGRYR